MTWCWRDDNLPRLLTLVGREFDVPAMGVRLQDRASEATRVLKTLDSESVYVRSFQSATKVYIALLLLESSSTIPPVRPPQSAPERTSFLGVTLRFTLLSGNHSCIYEPHSLEPIALFVRRRMHSTGSLVIMKRIVGIKMCSVENQSYSLSSPPHTK